MNTCVFIWKHACKKYMLNKFLTYIFSVHDYMSATIYIYIYMLMYLLTLITYMLNTLMSKKIEKFHIINMYVFKKTCVEYILHIFIVFEISWVQRIYVHIDNTFKRWICEKKYLVVKKYFKFDFFDLNWYEGDQISQKQVKTKCVFIFDLLLANLVSVWVKKKSKLM